MGVAASIQKMFRGRSAWTLLFLLVAAGSAGAFFWSRSRAVPNFIQVSRGSIVRTVNATGKIRPSKDVDLAFAASGRIGQVNARVGDRVGAGVVLARLDAGDLEADLRVAEAGAEAARAKLAELERGTRPEEIRIQEGKVAAAVASVADARQGLRDRIQEAFTKADDAVRTKTDPLFSNPRSSNPTLSYDVGDTALKNRLERGRAAMEALLSQWKAALDSKDGDLEPLAADAAKNLSLVSAFLDDASLFANALAASSTLTQMTINTYRSDISTGRTNVSGSAVNLSTANEKYRSEESDLELERRELLLDRAGATKEAIDAQKAAVSQADASVLKAQAELSQTVIRAPFAGVITRQDADPGEAVVQGSALISIQNESGLEIEADIPEADIGSVKAGNPVQITVDAFPGERFSGTVVHVDPAETVIDGAVNFKIRVSFQNPDSRLKSGLTANLTVETVRHDEALLVPAAGIIETDQGSFVRRREGKTIRQVAVQTGIRSQDGMVEILSGLQEGDEIEASGPLK